MKTTLYATVTNGTFSNRKNFDELIQQWEGKRIAITVEKAKTKRSNQQNRYYHGVVIPDPGQQIHLEV